MVFGPFDDLAGHPSGYGFPGLGSGAGGGIASQAGDGVKNMEG